MIEPELAGITLRAATMTGAAGPAGSMGSFGLTGAAGLVLVVAARSLLRRRSRRRRHEHIEASLGLTLDLVAVVVGSGGTVRQAVEAVAASGPEAIRPAFQAVVDRTGLGHRLPDALAEASADLGPSFHPLLGTLLNAEIDGAPVGPILSRLVDDLEHRDRWRADESAGRLPILLLPPLVVCLLPAVVVGAVIPLVIVALRGLGW